MRLVFDIEADGLKPTRLWCVSAVDVDTKQFYEYGPSQIEQAVELLGNAEVLIGHNILGFDLPTLERLHGLDTTGKTIIDTLVLSRLINPTQEGGHSLETWGGKLNFPKVEHEDWTQFTPDMMNRCSTDVRLNLKVFEILSKSGKNFSETSKDLEHAVYPIIRRQIEHGFLFDLPKAVTFEARLADELASLEDEVRETFRPEPLFIKTVRPKRKKDGTLSRSGLRPEEFDRLSESGSFEPFDRYDIQEFNLGSRDQIGKRLVGLGWKPKLFTPTGKPQIDESSLEGIEFPEGELILRYLTVQKIKSFVSSWIEAVGDDGRLHGFVNPNGAVTGRMTHSKPNMAQIPSSRKLYGKECRELFIVPKGYKLVGVDAEGLEMRMLAHYMNNRDYIIAVSEGDKRLGTDAHTLNMHAAGCKDRDTAKTLIYALIYGAADKKLGSVLDGNKAAGARARASLFQQFPDLDDLIDRVKTAAARGFLKGLDGRLIRVRKINSSLNTLLQGGGGIVMKKALVILDDLATKAGLDYHFVGNIHDEFQVEVKEEDVEKFSEVALDSMRLAGEFFNMNCPLAGEVNVGDNWAETH